MGLIPHFVNEASARAAAADGARPLALFLKGSAMPIIHVSLRTGKPEAYRQAIFDGLYRAMRETLNVPEDDQFMTMSEHDAANFRTGTAYGVARSADVVYIQITV